MTDNPLMITCALVGAELTRNDTPYLPLAAGELSAAAAEAVKAGAQIIHLHVRDDSGAPSQDPEHFRLASESIRNACDCILQFSTGGAAGTPLQERCAPLHLKPEMATLSMGTLNFGKGLFENTEETIRTIATEIRKYGILPELEIFDAGMLDTTNRLMKSDWFPDRFHMDLLFGVPGGIGGTLKDLLFQVERLPIGQQYTVAAIGKHQLPLTAHAVFMGGHVRVGFEDNIYYRKGELARSNALFVSRIARIAREAGRPVATVQEARSMLGL